MGLPEEVEDPGSLVYAPTWAVASVCFVFIVCSLIVERIIFTIGQFWRSRKQIALFEALEKIKEELMVVGFISLALTVGSRYVSKICVPKEWANFMPQCVKPKELDERQDSESTFAETHFPEQICSAKMGSQMKEHDDMELGVFRSHEDGSGNPTRLVLQKEGSIPVAADSMNEPHEAEVGGHMEGEDGEDSIMEISDSQDGGVHVQRRMSYIERVTRGVHGEDYHKLEPSALHRHASV